MGNILIEEMGEQVANGILFKLKSSGIQVDNIDFNEIADRETGALERPVANISINSGSFQKVVSRTWKQKIIVSLFVMVQELRGEEARRGLEYKLITQIAKVLLLEKLGLSLQDPLIPVSFNNVTDSKYAGAGYLIYQLDLTCSFNIQKETEKDYGELESIVNEYFLHTPIDDGVRGDEGLVVLLGIYGGDAFSVNSVLPSIFGGHAGSKRGSQSIYGGNARSTN